MQNARRIDKDLRSRCPCFARPYVFERNGILAQFVVPFRLFDCGIEMYVSREIVFRNQSFPVCEYFLLARPVTRPIRVEIRRQRVIVRPDVAFAPLFRMWSVPVFDSNRAVIDLPDICYPTEKGT